MGNKAGRVALFSVPLQQQWPYRADGDRAPRSYLHSDAPLYYYSFTDAWIAMAYKSLTKEQQARFDPMITTFNPTDMYAADHIRRVLQDQLVCRGGCGQILMLVSGKDGGPHVFARNALLHKMRAIAPNRLGVKNDGPQFIGLNQPKVHTLPCVIFSVFAPQQVGDP
jgi:hypothetical protein